MCNNKCLTVTRLTQAALHCTSGVAGPAQRPGINSNDGSLLPDITVIMDPSLP